MSMRPWVLVTLVLGLIAASAAPVQAVGGFDGIYLMTATPGVAGADPLTVHVTLSQNGSALVLINLNPDGTWTYGAGTIIGSSASGIYHEPDGTVIGTFAVVLFGIGSFAGAAVIDGVPYSLSAVKVF